jgi:predicted permease
VAVLTLPGANTVFLVSLLLIAVGYALRRLAVFDERAGQTLTRLALYVTLPAVILSTVPRIPLTRSLLLFPLACLAAGGAAFFLGLGLSRRYEPRSRGVMIMSSLGYNNGLFAFPIAQAIWGAVGVQYLAVFDLANVVLLLGVNYLVAAWYAARAAGRSPELSAGYILGNLLRSVPLVAYAAAVVMNLVGFRLPALAATLVDVAARGNMPVVLVLLGVYLDFRLPRREIGAAIAVLALRTLVGLSLGLALYFLLPLEPLMRKVLLVALLLPVGATVTPFAAAFGLNHRLAALATNALLVVSFVLFWAVVNLL